MANNRLGRINEEIMRELSALLRTVKDPRVANAMVSITRVEATPDMRYAKVYISVLGDKTVLHNCMRGLKSAAGFLRRELSSRLTLRYTPELAFAEDDSITHVDHIMELLEGLDKKPE